MKRFLLVFATAVLFTSAFLASSQHAGSQPQPATPFAGAYPHEGKFIPISAWRLYDAHTGGSLGWKAGDQCSLRVETDYFPNADSQIFWNVDHQIIVRNQHDEIIAMQDLEGTLQKTTTGTWSCESYYEIDVPEATFYTVYLGDQRIVSYAAEDFPIPESESPGISV